MDDMEQKFDPLVELGLDRRFDEQPLIRLVRHCCTRRLCNLLDNRVWRPRRSEQADDLLRDHTRESGLDSRRYLGCGNDSSVGRLHPPSANNKPRERRS